jgi:hypothetical protein
MNASIDEERLHELAAQHVVRTRFAEQLAARQPPNRRLG